jgi:hypothetical protein
LRVGDNEEVLLNRIKNNQFLKMQRVLEMVEVMVAEYSEYVPYH